MTTDADTGPDESPPYAWATVSAIAINVVVYGAMAAVFGTLAFSAVQAFEAGATYRPAVAAGEYWRLFTANWIHFYPLHIVSNMLMLLIWGVAVEQRIGSVRFALFYLAAGLAGSVASVVVNPSVVGAGASGAIAGVAGMLLALWLKGDHSISGRNLAVNLALNAMLPVFVGSIDWIAHVGGFAAGATLQLLNPRRS